MSFGILRGPERAHLQYLLRYVRVRCFLYVGMEHHLIKECSLHPVRSSFSRAAHQFHEPPPSVCTVFVVYSLTVLVLTNLFLLPCTSLLVLSAYFAYGLACWLTLLTYSLPSLLTYVRPYIYITSRLS